MGCGGRLDAGFFRSRWELATPGEHEYLAAMAVDGDGPSSSGEVASRLGKQINQLGPTRAKLISKGLLYAPEYGVIAFTVPTIAIMALPTWSRSADPGPSERG